MNGYINKPEVVDFARKLVGRYIVALLSNFGSAFWETNDKVWHLDKIFSKDKMFVSSDIGLCKPYEGIYLYTLAKLKTRAENCVFIDDNEDNIKTAKKLGFHAIHFKTLESLKKELSNLGIKG